MCNSKMCLLRLLTFVAPVLIVVAQNNVCKHRPGYYLGYATPDCYYDPDVTSGLPKIVLRQGYMPTSYSVVSRDGYISRLFRIRRMFTKPYKSPVLLVHAAYVTDSGWVLEKNNSFAFVLADAGYDVWVVDLRGTQYSVEHTSLTTEDNEYWNYSLDEIVDNDVSLWLDLVQRKSGNSGVIYVGHAIGSSALMGYTSQHPFRAKSMVKLAVFMSPSAEIHHTRTLLLKIIFGKFGARLWELIYGLRIAKYVCADRYLQAIVATLQNLLGVPLLFDVLVNYFGRNTEIPLYLAPVILKHVFRGLSIKVFVQLYQASIGNFGRYDYGKAKNLEKYGSVLPPIYNVTRMEFPVYLVYAKDDAYSTIPDVEALYAKLSPSAKRYGKYQVPHGGFNHLAYSLADTANELLYKHLIEMFDRVITNTNM